MSKRIDLTNQRFGRLVVLSFHSQSKRTRGTLWLCKCDCGVIKLVLSDSLRQGTTQSCGCLRREFTSRKKSKGKFIASFNLLFRSYKKSAKDRSYSFELTQEEFKIITKQNCYYCGIEPKQEKKSANINGSYIFNGVDRIDNNIGYILTNCVSCCKFCNVAKGQMTLKEFDSWLEKLYFNRMNS